MGQTAIEKILDAHSAEEARAGRTIWVDLDVRSARDFGGANVVKNFEWHYPGESVADPARTFFTFDCVVPANTIAYANNQHRCRQFARTQGIRVYDTDRGIGSHVMIEEGLAVPGTVIVGTDSHLNILGAVGAFGQGMGDQDIAFAFREGRTWFDVPETMRVTLAGELPPGTTPKDLALHLVGQLGASGALGRTLELYGPAVEALDLAGRITLASMATEMGAITALIPPSGEVLDYCRERTGDRSLEGVCADPDAVYCAELEFDLSDLTPVVARPHRPDDVIPVMSLPEIPVDSVFIGSCTNGTFEDIAAAARMLEGRSVHARVQARIAPATRVVYARLLETGILADLFTSGCNIISPGCAGCAQGQVGMTGEGRGPGVDLEPQL